MEPRVSIVDAEQGSGAGQQLDADDPALMIEAQDGREEAFEAVIVRLDHASAELLFRTAGL